LVHIPELLAAENRAVTDDLTGKKTSNENYDVYELLTASMTL